MSPYLFVMVMQVLSKLLQNFCSRIGFKYHSNCSKIQLNHFCFADDLMIFSYGSMEVVTGYMEILKQFEAMSGLKANSSKSVIFFCGVDEDTKKSILEDTGYAEREFPIKYLGVPLITTQLSRKDCEPLIEKVTARINSWTAKYLSYAGRLQLIKYVLFSIQSYWCRMFIIPQKVVHIIEQKFARFLWSGLDMKSTKAKVNWEDVCSPKEEEGLGLKKISDWNKALGAKLIWNLFCRAGSVWIAWINAYILKGRSFWRVGIPLKCSWSWRKILELRPMVRQFMKHVIGNGVRSFFLYDNWLPDGPIDLKWGSRVRYDLSILENAKVSKLVRGDQSVWPATISTDLLSIQSSIPSMMRPNELIEDRIEWKPGVNGEFSTSTAWEAIRIKKSRVPWFNIVWFSKKIPKHSFILWLAVQNRLSTQQRLLSWGFINTMKCGLCGANVEDMDHLFFLCSFSKSVWAEVKRLCMVNKQNG